MIELDRPRARFELRWRDLMRAGSETGLRLRPGEWALPLLAFAAGLALALTRRSRPLSGGSGLPRRARPAAGRLQGAALRRRPDA